MLLKSLIVFLVSLVSLVNAADLYNFIYTTDSKSRLVYVSTDNSSNSLEKSIVNCSVISDPDAVNEVLTTATDPLIPIDQDSFNTLVKSCNSIKPSSVLPPKPISGLFGLSSNMIAPGTKWCGPGNISSGYDDLGVKVETDKCCRDHDHCPMSIDAFQSKYGLKNTQPYSSSLCDCDLQFKTCLKKASQTELEATLFGMIYFNVLKTKCFQQVKPKGQCLEYSGLLIKRCAKQVDLNTTELVYQFQTSGLFL